MKSVFFLAAILSFSSIIVNAQCDKKITWTSSKTEYLDANGAVKNTVTLPTTIQTTPNHITVTIKSGDGGEDVIEGDIKNEVCNWTQAYKEGTISFKSELAKPNGETRQASITIEAKEGKIDMIVEVENTDGGKMRLLIDSYKEEA